MKTLSILSKQRVLKTFGLFGLFIIFCLFANPIYAQANERTVTGIVKTMDGPLFGAAIVLKGTATGVVTNQKGEFTFPKELKENDVLVVSYLGYETSEVTITGNTSFIEPFLEDIAVVVVAAMRTKASTTSLTKNIN